MPASDIRAAKAYIELLVKDNKLAAGLNKAAGRIKSFGSTISSAGVKLFAGGEAIAGPLEAAAGVYAEMGANAARSAQKTGLSVEATTTLGYAAKVSGGQMEDLEEGMDKMSKTLEDAQEGSATAQQSLRALGLTIGDLKNLTQEDRFKLMADRISKIQDPAQKAAAAMNIFGERSVKNLMPLLDRGADGIDKLQQHARDLGLQMSGEDAKGALEFSDKIDDLWAVMKMGVFTIGSAVVPPLMKFVTAVTQIAVKISAWIGEHKKLATTIFLVATGVAAAGAVLVGLGAAISVVGMALGGLAAAIGIAGAVIGTIISPIGLIVIGIGAAAAAFLYFSGVGAAVGNSIVQAFQSIWNAIKFVLDNTSTASEAWSAALTEATFLVQQAWTAVKDSLTVLWDSIKGDAIQMWDSLADAIIDSATIASKVFSDIWAHTLALWEKAVGYTAKVVRDVVSPPEGKQSGDATEAAISGHVATFMAAHPKILNAISSLPGIGAFQPGAFAANVQKELDEAKHPKPQTAQDKYEADAAKKDSDQIDADLNARLAANKKDYDDKRKYLNQMQAQQHAGDAQETEDKKNADKAAAKKAEDELAAAKKAYEDALKAKHDASGEQSLADQAKSIFGLITPAAAPPVPVPDSNKLNTGMNDAMAKTTAASTFNASAAAGMFGGGPANQHLSTIAQQTTKMNEVLAQIARAVRNGGTVRFG